MIDLAHLKVTERNERRSIRGSQWNALIDALAKVEFNSPEEAEQEVLDPVPQDLELLTLPDDVDLSDIDAAPAAGLIEIILDVDGSLKYRAILMEDGSRITLGNFNDPEVAADILRGNI